MEDGLYWESEGRISDGEGGEGVRKWWIRAGYSPMDNEMNIPHNYLSTEKKIKQSKRGDEDEGNSEG
jgi:hypothetical protein